MTKLLSVYLVMFIAWAPLVAAQPDDESLPSKGVVWQPPEGLPRAEQDLQTMADVGIQSVRTELIRNRALLSLADTLGIELYVDLPIERLAAARLLDTLDYARAVLDTLIGLAQIHPSVRHIGLARNADTSDSTACGYFEDLVSRAQSTAPPGTQFYYLTRFFFEDDACASRVDFVLADVRDRDDPVSPLRLWTRHGERPPIGVGAAGTWVRGDTLRGLNIQASPERQARYLESTLPLLLSDTLSVRLPAVFVHGWRDVRLSYPSTAHDIEYPYLQRYGLHTIEEKRRPAFNVVEGIYASRQKVFAFDRGAHAPRPTPWILLFGWGVIVMLALFYALSPRFRHMVPRYFQAHFFFREAVREGRDVLFGASIVLTAALAIAAGLSLYVVIEAARVTDPFATAVYWLPGSIQGMIATLLARPTVLIVLVACIYILGVLAWSVVLSLFSRRRYRIAPVQVLMLVAWPRWPYLLVMLAAMVLSSMQGPRMAAFGILLGAWMIFEFLALVRTLFDLTAVTRMPPYFLAPAFLLHPGVLSLIAAAVALLPFVPELTFLWHTIVRS